MTRSSLLNGHVRVFEPYGHLLADPQVRYFDLGPDFYQSHRNPHRQERNLIRQLQQLTGKTVILTSRPATPAA